MVTGVDVRRRSLCTGAGRAVVVAGLLLQSLLLASFTNGAENKPKRLAKPHPYLVTTPPLSEDDFRVFVAMHKPCTVKAEGTGLTDLAKELSKMVGVEVKVDVDELRRAKPTKIDPNVQVTAKYEGVPLQSILWSILPPRGLDYRVKDGRLVITSRAKCTRHLVMWKYPVTDLCANSRQFDNLVNQVHAMMPAEEWENMGGYASLMPDQFRRCFTISHAQSNQDRILEFLVQQRRKKNGETDRP